LHRLEQMQPDKIELGLGRIKRVAAATGLDHPQFRIITVAGTNGKGSTVAYCDAILSDLGYRTGVYTSPHFIEFNERIVVDNERVDDSLLCEAFDAIESHRGDVALTYFEFTTLAAVYCFTAAKIDVAILEVGLGGRLDAVNAWDSDIACISSIGIDHIDWLGDDRESIGHEKACVARRGKVLVCGDTNPPESIAAAVNSIGATLAQRNRDFHVESADEHRWRYHDAKQNFLLPRPAIAGDWACDNAAVAICTMDHFLDSPLLQSTIERALARVTMTGRMQTLMADNVPVILDVAHNAAAAEKLAGFLTEHPIEGVTRAVFACMQDKDSVAIVESMSPCVGRWYIAEIDYPRAFGSFHVVGPALEVLG